MQQSRNSARREEERLGFVRSGTRSTPDHKNSNGGGIEPVFQLHQIETKKIRHSGILALALIDRVVNGFEDQARASTMSEILTLKILRNDADAFLSFLTRFKELRSNLGTQLDVKLAVETLRVRMLEDTTN